MNDIPSHPPIVDTCLKCKSVSGNRNMKSLEKIVRSSFSKTQTQLFRNSKVTTGVATIG